MGHEFNLILINDGLIDWLATPKMAYLLESYSGWKSLLSFCCGD